MPAPEMARFGMAFLAVLLPPLVLRAAATWDRAGGFLLWDFRGALSDVSIALLALAILYWVGRASRGLAVVVILAWIAVHHANSETIRALGSVASHRDIGFLGSSTFLLGSALQFSRPVLLAAITGACVALTWYAIRRPDRRWITAGGCAAVVMLVGQGAWPPSDEVAYWRQLNPIDYNARFWLSDAIESAAPEEEMADAGPGLVELWPELAADVGGRSLLPPGARARNVLLIVVESIPGGYLESVAEVHGFVPKIGMPRLDALARANLRYSNFLVNQAKTNRGLYAILCGDLPNLGPGLPKMTGYAMGGAKPRCLPEVLGNAGYETLYIQAAPLAFMNKKQFMLRAGFDQVRGDEFFEGGYMRTKWGVDDRSFYEQVVPSIANLDRTGRPWFVTTLNVGTHHPFVVPGAQRGGATRADAVAYADRALAEFLEMLRDRGLLDQTIVLITTDESSGVPGGDGAWRRMTKNWGALVAVLPEPVSLRVDQPFSQVDIALSILDYLGLADRGRHFLGRSIFRHYDAGRLIFFAHSNLALTGFVDKSDRVVVCILRKCKGYSSPDGMIFGRSRQRVAWDGTHLPLLRKMVRRSLIRPGAGRGERELRIVAERVDVSGNIPKILSGGQYVTIEENEWLEIVIEVEARGTGENVELNHALRRDHGTSEGLRSVVHLVRETLTSGATLRVHYTFAPTGRVESLEARTSAYSPDGGDWQLIFRKAHLRIRNGADRPGTLVRVVENSITVE